MNQNYKIRIRNLSMTWINIVIQLWAWQIYTWWFGTCACQSGNSGVLPSLSPCPLVRFGFPVSNFTKFVGRLCSRPFRSAIPRCNLSRFSNHQRTNQRGGYEKSSSRATQTPNSIRSTRPRLPPASKRCNISDNY